MNRKLKALEEAAEMIKGWLVEGALVDEKEGPVCEAACMLVWDCVRDKEYLEL